MALKANNVVRLLINALGQHLGSCRAGQPWTV